MGLICNDIDILGGESNENMGELIATPLLINYKQSVVQKKPHIFVATDAAETHYGIVNVIKHITRSKNMSE